jgi:type II secretory pathway pseudopilin PulG
MRIAGIMRLNPTTLPPRPSRHQQAASLLEMIAVLAVIAILAATLLPALIRQLDKLAADQESASLKALGEALERAILRQRHVPSPTDWASFVAAELGAGIAGVTNNARLQPRFFLVDPALQIGATVTGQAYQQTSTGSAIVSNGMVIPPVSPRLILLSSIGQPLKSCSNGVPGTSDFNAIWNWNDASATPPAAAILAGLSRGADLKVQRLNLSRLFVRLLLSTYSSPGLGRFTIDVDSNPVTNTVPTGAGYTAYYLQGAILRLLSHQGVLDSASVIAGDTPSYVYDHGVWRSTISGFMPTVAFNDWSFIVSTFLNSPTNTASGAASPPQVVQAMVNYMNCYDTWAATGTFTHDTNWNAAVTAQGVLMSNIYKCAISPYPPQVPCASP